MREILFRGKRMDNGEWVSGDLRHGGYYQGDMTVYIVAPFADMVISYPVFPCTVGQYTGLKDKEGKRIFEGDIFEYSLRRYTVEWEDGGFTIFTDEIGFEAWEICVIGNIHDKPELMDGDSHE